MYHETGTFFVLHLTRSGSTAARALNYVSATYYFIERQVVLRERVHSSDLNYNNRDQCKWRSKGSNERPDIVVGDIFEK